MSIKRNVSRRGNATLVIVAVLAVLAVAGYFGFKLLRGQPVPPAGGREIAEPFLKSIREDRVDAAWASTTAEFKSDLGRENFARYLEAHPAVMDSVEYVESQPVVLDHVPRTECTFRTTPASGAPAKVKVLVAQERGEWRVERLLVE